MRFKLTIEVDIDALQQTYRQGLGLTEQDEIPETKEIIELECNGWLSSSVIHLIGDIEEVEE